MTPLFLSIVSPETLKSIGFWLLIFGLVAEAAIIVTLPSGRLEKRLSVLFTLTITAGVWIEEIGANAIDAAKDAELGRLTRAITATQTAISPRSLSADTQQRISEIARRFKGTRFDFFVFPVGTPDTPDFASQILSALAAHWSLRDAPIPTGGQLFRGVGVAWRKSADENAKKTAEALLLALKAENINARMLDPFEGDMGGQWTTNGPGLRLQDLRTEGPAPVRVLVGSKP